MFRMQITQTINDVMVGVTQAALSRYLNRKYGKQFLNLNLLQILLVCKIITHIPSKTTTDRPVAIYKTVSYNMLLARLDFKRLYGNNIFRKVN